MIVGLCGYSKVGKDTLCEQLGNFERFAFADVLKQELTTMLKAVGLEADLWGADKEEWRELMVYWGRKRRSIDPDYWVKQLYMRMAPIQDRRICITDVRYLNEAQWVRKQNGVIIGIHRPNYGPANEEEEYSILELRRELNPPWITNDTTPRDLERIARKVMSAARLGL